MILPKFIEKNKIIYNSIIINFNCSIDKGLIVSFENDLSNKWIGVFEKGGNNYNNIKLLSNDKVLIIANGQGYIVNPKTRTRTKLNSPCYIDIFVKTNFIILSSYTLIDIYNESELIKQIQIDDIDGIRLLKNTGSRLYGEFRQISSIDFNEWLQFEIDINTFELFCDKGRMWYETIIKNGKVETKYMTMDLK